ncbi:MAG TPA: hypothetical protein VLJ88_10415 [Propionibacteriaceae bacterium]|nr:hypothetical protein [Propionibacteriaceae bacterium]
MGEQDEATITWLLASDEPAIRALARRDLLGEEVPPASGGPRVDRLLRHGTEGHPYRKWTGVHWRLISLAELGVDPTLERVQELTDLVLTWLSGVSYPEGEGLPRRHASIEGNALAACCRLGRRDDPRADRLAGLLEGWQWPDGGWNCDQRASGRRSSFHETLGPMWGLHEFGRREPAERAAELLLEHRLFMSGDRVINKQFTDLRFPPYWHYDILQALLILSRMGLVSDPRAADALDVVEQKRRPDGRWAANGYWWRATGDVSRELVDWWRGEPNDMITLNALRVLKASGRLRLISG